MQVEQWSRRRLLTVSTAQFVAGVAGMTLVRLLEDTVARLLVAGALVVLLLLSGRILWRWMWAHDNVAPRDTPVRPWGRSPGRG